MPPIWLLAAIPWIVVPIVLIRRSRGSAELSQYPPKRQARGDATVAGDAPAANATHSDLVSVIIPARDEAHNIEPCIRSVLASDWRALELFVVDDHSTDGTGAIAQRIAAEDSRLTVLDAPQLPDGWFGKQWACHTAVQHARGSTLIFGDADTRHTPELIPRTLAAFEARGADLLSVFGAQEMHTFWERLLQPQILTILMGRYGNGEGLSRSTNPLDKIANGQFFVVRRAAYDRVGGHEAVRNHVAEDLRLAQEVCRSGGAVHMIFGREYLSTRMYEGLGALMRGWGKNVYAAGRDTLAVGPVTHAVVRALLPAPALWNVAPIVLAVAAAFGAFGTAAPAVFWWGITCYAASALFFIGVHHDLKVPLWYSFLHPLGGAMTGVLMAQAAWRGDRVSWKGRSYRSVSPPSVGRT